MRLPENAYVIVDCSEPCKNGLDLNIQVILHKTLKTDNPWVKLFYERNSNSELVRFTHKFGACLTIIYDCDSVPSVGDVIVTGNVYGKFGTYWHHGAFDKEIEEILKQHRAYSDGYDNQKHV